MAHMFSRLFSLFRKQAKTEEPDPAPARLIPPEELPALEALVHWGERYAAWARSHPREYSSRAISYLAQSIHNQTTYLKRSGITEAWLRTKVVDLADILAQMHPKLDMSIGDLYVQMQLVEWIRHASAMINDLHQTVSKEIGSQITTETKLMATLRKC